MIELSAIAVGNKLRLVGGLTAEVLEIVNDEWAKVRLLETPEDPTTSGTRELCHATDIIEVV